MEVEPKNVIERLKEQLKLAGCVRGYLKPIYKDAGNGKKELLHYARQHIRVVAADILELCALARDQNDDIVRAQTKGCAFAASCPGRKGEDPMAILYADDVFYLIDFADTKKAPEPKVPEEIWSDSQ